MPRITLRLGVALLTFGVGIAAAWLSGAVSSAETAALEYFLPTPTIEAVETQASDRDDEATAVYEAVLREKFLLKWGELPAVEAETNGGCKLCEALDEQQREDFVSSQSKAMPSALRETLEDYAAHMNQTRGITELPNLGVPYTLIHQRELEHIFRRNNDGWAEFYKRYPGSSGTVDFSNVGFDRVRKQAFVYVAHGCGWLCGSGDYVLLEKRNGMWTIISETGLWVS